MVTCLRNVPVIMACNKSPKYDSPVQTQAFETRVTKCNFSSLGPVVKFSVERLAKTLLLFLQTRNAKKLQEPVLQIGD